MPRHLQGFRYRDPTKPRKWNYSKECPNIYYKEVSQQYYKYYREIDKSYSQKPIGRSQGRLTNQDLGKSNQLNQFLACQIQNRVDKSLKINQLNQFLAHQIQNRVDRSYLEQIKYIQRRIPYYLRLLIYVVIFIFRFQTLLF